ncbi:unnamed protein product, partial [Allacma fusca]
GLLSWGR